MSDLSLFDPPHIVEAARQDGIDRSYEAADDWKIEARQQVEWLARTVDDFTTDEVIGRLEQLDFVLPSNLMALGSVMQSAARDGVIRKTGETRRTKISRRHRDLTACGGR